MICVMLVSITECGYLFCHVIFRPCVRVMSRSALISVLQKFCVFMRRLMSRTDMISNSVPSNVIKCCPAAQRTSILWSIVFLASVRWLREQNYLQVIPALHLMVYRSDILLICDILWMWNADVVVCLEHVWIVEMCIKLVWVTCIKIVWATCTTS